MKKLFLIILAVLMMTGISFASEERCCDCPEDVYIANGLFAGINTREVSECTFACPGVKIGAVDYDGESLSVIDYATGEGYDCRKPKNPGYLTWALCECEDRDDILRKGNYGLVIKILTPGVSWYSEASITPPTVTMVEFETEEELCEGNLEESQYRRYLNYHFDDARKTTLITECKRGLFQRNELYIGVTIPPLVIDQAVVPNGTPIRVALGFFDCDKVCAPLCPDSVFCPCVTTVAFLGCWNNCCYTIGYMPLDAPWWSGIAITNLSDHNGSAILLFGNGTDKQMKVVKVNSESIVTFLPQALGVDLTGSCWCVIKTDFSARVTGFTGNETLGYGLDVTGCGGCQ